MRHGVEIRPDLAIPLAEISFVTSRSSGPGGQHVNKVETRVSLRFDVGRSAALAPEQKARLRERLATRISRAGVLRVSAQRERSQAANRGLVLARFAQLLRQALAEEAERHATAPPRGLKVRRLAAKRHRAEVKRRRRGPLEGE